MNNVAAQTNTKPRRMQPLNAAVLNSQSASAGPGAGLELVSGLEFVALFRHVFSMSTVTIELESDAVRKLESARLNPQETFSDVVRRASFP